MTRMSTRMRMFSRPINLIGCNVFIKSNASVCKAFSIFLLDIIFEKLWRFGDRNLSAKNNMSYYRLVKVLFGFVVIDLRYFAELYVVVFNNLIAYLNEMHAKPKNYF